MSLLHGCSVLGIIQGHPTVEEEDFVLPLPPCTAPSLALQCVMVRSEPTVDIDLTLENAIQNCVSWYTQFF